MTSRSADRPYRPITRLPPESDPGKRLEQPFLFPVTLVLVLEYGALVIFPALLKGRSFSLVYSAPLVAIGISLIVETAMSRRPFTLRRTPPPASMGFALALVGLAASLIKSLLGAGTYATQIGTTSASPAASLATPFVSWIGIGAGLVIFSWAHNGCSRRRALTYLGTLVVLQEAVGLLLAGYGGAFLVIGVPIFIGCLIMRLVRLRYFVAVAMILLLLWPALLQTRTDIRAASGAGIFYAPQDPFARLQLDELLALAEHIKIPSSVLLSPVQMLRYGLIPRALDPGRPELYTGQIFSVAAGGSPINSLTYTTLGSLYAESGWGLLAVYSVLVAWAIGILLRRNNPWIFALVVSGAPLVIGTEPLYPDNVVAVIQIAVSAIAACLALRGWYMLFGRQDYPIDQQLIWQPRGRVSELRGSEVWPDQM